jgi:hypothetical protein
MVFNLLHAMFLILYPVSYALGGISFSYLLVATCVLLPIIHQMILRQQADGQQVSGQEVSWEIGGGDHIDEDDETEGFN